MLKKTKFLGLFAILITLLMYLTFSKSNGTWFVAASDVQGLSNIISRFPESGSDEWSDSNVEELENWIFKVGKHGDHYIDDVVTQMKIQGKDNDFRYLVVLYIYITHFVDLSNEKSVMTLPSVREMTIPWKLEPGASKWPWRDLNGHSRLSWKRWPRLGGNIITSIGSTWEDMKKDNVPSLFAR